jgi:hypothetical protein
VRLDYSRRFALILVVSVGLSPCLMAWDGEGHMMVAALAWRQLSSDALRNRVTTLLKLNPDYSKWQSMILAGTAANDVPQMIFMIAATWPDQIKTEPGYANDKTPSSSNIGYS